ncbi:MAG: hypothetical protein ACRDZ1_12215 [Acidimicrobiia bacterium]
MRKLRPGRVVLGVIGLGIGVVAVLALREATLSTHQRVTGRGMELVVSAKTKGGEKSQTLSEMVEAQLLACRLEVNSDLDGRIEPLGSGRFRAELALALDQTNRRQFRGCVEDWIIDHLQLDVVQLTEIR